MKNISDEDHGKPYLHFKDIARKLLGVKLELKEILPFYMYVCMCRCFLQYGAVMKQNIKLHYNMWKIAPRQLSCHSGKHWQITIYSEKPWWDHHPKYDI